VHGRAVPPGRRRDGEHRARGRGRVPGLHHRARAYDIETDDGESEIRAEYGVGVWSDLEAARGLFAAVARDAAGVGADRTRVLVPETPRHVSDAAFTRAGISDEPDFVLAKELAGW